MIDRGRTPDDASRGSLSVELAALAHELKAAIAVALAMAATASEAEDASLMRHDLERIELNLGAVRELLDALLDTERLRCARGLRRGPADIAVVVRDAAGGLAHVAARRRVRLVVVAPAELPGVVDSEHVAVAVRNLVANAVRHAPDGGVVHTRLAVRGGRARIEVADNGPGVPEAAREAVFRRFARSGSDGSGLGLSIVRDVARAHGGCVKVGCAPEGGALFTLEIPLDRAARPLSAVAGG